VIATIDVIRPLPEVEVVETMVVWTDDGWLGGIKPPVATIVEGI
jgi:hypothetical protein